MTRIEDGKAGRRGRRRQGQRRRYRRRFRVGGKGPGRLAPCGESQLGERNAIPPAEESHLKSTSPGAGAASRGVPTAPGGKQLTFGRADAQGTER